MHNSSIHIAQATKMHICTNNVTHAMFDSQTCPHYRRRKKSFTLENNSEPESQRGIQRNESKSKQLNSLTSHFSPLGRTSNAILSPIRSCGSNFLLLGNTFFTSKNPIAKQQPINSEFMNATMSS